MTFQDADLALQELLAGNRRYRTGQVLHPHQTEHRRQALTQNQQPFAAILGCSDSRVPPELIFDQGLGDLFVVRVAGNILDDAGVMASLEFAVVRLKTPLIVVLGHQHCGAVEAAVAAYEANQQVAGHLGFVVNAIRPAVAEAHQLGGNFVDQAIRRNIQRNVQKLQQMDWVGADKAFERRVRIVGAYYHLESGQVEILE